MKIQLVSAALASSCLLSSQTTTAFTINHKLNRFVTGTSLASAPADEITDVVNDSPPITSIEQKFDPAVQRVIPVIERMSGASVTSVKSGEAVDSGTFLKSGEDKTMLVFGTYAADFNAIEYAQRLRYYLPQLKNRGITKVGLVLNCEPEAAKTMVKMIDLKTDATASDGDEDTMVELLVDPTGNAGRQFGVGRGWRPDDEEMSPYLKLFGMLWGLGAWATLPAVIGGYIGNPFFGQPWVEDALAVGQKNGRFPSNALELDGQTGDVKVNKFTELPVVGEWERRPLELATLRLQNMVDISIKNWQPLAPTKEALNAGVLTQLGGITVVDSSSGNELFQWKDPGICAVANFEQILTKIPLK